MLVAVEVICLFLRDIISPIRKVTLDKEELAGGDEAGGDDGAALVKAVAGGRTAEQPQGVTTNVIFQRPQTSSIWMRS